MTVKYLGETVVQKSETPFANDTASDTALRMIFMCGQIDGAHHKAWCLDQVARILHDSEVIYSKREWSNGHVEWAIRVGHVSDDYVKWVQAYRGDYDSDGHPEYDYDVGIAP